MEIQIVTLFPDYFQSLHYGVMGKALFRNDIKLSFFNPRSVAQDVHKTVDDEPFGGGDGMLMTAPILSRMLNVIEASQKSLGKVVYLSPKGKPWTDARAKQWASQKWEKPLTLICARYAGVDQRFINTYVDEVISLGDFVLTGAEPAALCLIDSLVRLRPHVLGNPLSVSQESFCHHLLEAPQFTRPRSFQGQQVPKTLLSGHHSHIDDYKKALSIVLTQFRRPDLLKKADLSPVEQKKSWALVSSLPQEELQVLGFSLKEREQIKAKNKKNSNTHS